MEQIKHRVAHYWSHRAEAFETQRLREFDSEKRERWLAEFRKYMPDERPLRILDIGTGTGFFACLLAEEGHEVTGIDLTPDMITHAEHMASVLGVDVRFQLMDAENPTFESGSFDVLVTRNLTWTLPHLEKAYREWCRILKPGGVLINFDADYNAALEDEEEHELPENHAHKLVPEEMKAEIESITGKTAERLSGATRYRTSAALAERYFANARKMVLANGENFPDGLCGGVLANALGGPVFLVKGTAVPTSLAKEFAQGHAVLEAIVLGGDKAVTDSTVREVFGLGAEEEIIVHQVK